MKIQAHDLSHQIDTPTYSLAQLTLDEFHCFWPKIEQLLDAVPHTWKNWTKEWIQASVEARMMMVWGIGPPPDMVLVFFTTVRLHPAQKVLCVEWAAGSFDSNMLPLLDATLTQYAQVEDCTRIEVIGRPGWEPHVKGLGFKRDAVVWSRAVPQLRIN